MPTPEPTKAAIDATLYEFMEPTTPATMRRMALQILSLRSTVETLSKEKQDLLIIMNRGRVIHD